MLPETSLFSKVVKNDEKKKQNKTKTNIIKSINKWYKDKKRSDKVHYNSHSGVPQPEKSVLFPLSLL